jgi:hypothetical protein
MFPMMCALGCAAFSALNIWLYAAHGKPVSLAAAVFCGLLALLNAGMALGRR